MKDRIKQNDHTGKWHIDGGSKGYNSQETAHNALQNYEKRISSSMYPMEPPKDDKGKLG